MAIHYWSVRRCNMYFRTMFLTWTLHYLVCYLLIRIRQQSLRPHILIKLLWVALCWKLSNQIIIILHLKLIKHVRQPYWLSWYIRLWLLSLSKRNARWIFVNVEGVYLLKEELCSARGRNVDMIRDFVKVWCFEAALAVGNFLNWFKVKLTLILEF